MCIYHSITCSCSRWGGGSVNSRVRSEVGRDPTSALDCWMSSGAGIVPCLSMPTGAPLTVHPVRGPHSLASGLESSRSRSPQDPHSKGRVFTSCSSKALPSFPRVCCYSNLLQTPRGVWPFSHLAITSPPGAWDQMAIFFSLHLVVGGA